MKDNGQVDANTPTPYQEVTKQPYRYAVAIRDETRPSGYIVFNFNDQMTFTRRNALKHLCRILSADVPELYLLKLYNGATVEARLYRYVDRRRPCPCCGR